VTNQSLVISLPVQHGSKAGEVLGLAFSDDPLMSFWLPDPSKRHKYVPQLMRSVARYCLLHGLVETTPEINGVSCWLPPGEPEYHYGSLLRTGFLPIPFRSGLRNYARMLANDAFMHSIRLRACPGPHWYLWVLGVEPGLQGQGIGSRLISNGLERADAQHLPCYLDVNNPRNIPLYQRFGFEVFEEGQSPGYLLHTWGMRRSAR
jgi:GNAT superfamily N-acetyltransferase